MSRRLWPALLVMALVYAAAAATFGRVAAVWSPDSGTRLWMVRQAAEGGSLVRREYPFAKVDPEHRLDPFRGYSSRLPRGYFSSYPPLFPALSVPGYRLFGTAGLVLLPLLAGLFAAYATARAGRELGLPGAPWALAAVGLGTPLLVYSTVFWDHSLQMACAALFAWLLARAVRREKPRGYLASGLALGAGIWLHETLLALAVAAAVGMVLTPRLRRALGPFLLGFVPPVALWALVNSAVYGAPLGPHLFAGPVDFRQPHYAASFLDLPAVYRRLMEQGFGSFGTGDGGWRLALLALAFALCSRISSASRRAAALLAVPCAYFAVTSVLETSWAVGLLQAAPLLLFALTAPAALGAPRGDPEPQSPAPLFFRWLRPTALLFTVAVVVNPIVPGLNWGSRYLLTALPLFFLLAWAGLAALRQEEEGRRPLTAAAVLALVAATLILQARSVQAVSRDLEYSAAVREAVHSVPAPVMVTDRWWLAAEAAPTAAPLLLAETEADREHLTAVLRTLSPGELAFIGTPRGADAVEAAITAAGLRATREENRAGMLFRTYVRFEENPK